MLPRINRALEEFRIGWNFHSLSTETNLSPYQKWIRGVIADRFAGFKTGFRDILEPDPNSYSIDLHNPFPLHEDTVEVEVPEVNNPLTVDELGRLRTIVDPLAQSSEYGVNLFVRTACYVANSIMKK